VIDHEPWTVLWNEKRKKESAVKNKNAVNAMPVVCSSSLANTRVFSRNETSDDSDRGCAVHRPHDDGGVKWQYDIDGDDDGDIDDDEDGDEDDDDMDDDEDGDEDDDEDEDDGNDGGDEADDDGGDVDDDENNDGEDDGGGR